MFGPAFSDRITEDNINQSLTFQIIKPWKTSLLWWLILLLGMLFISGRLFYLQAMKGEHNRKMADEQRIRLIQVPASRGLITDRNGIALVQNQPIFRQIDIDPQTGIELTPVSRETALNLESQGYGASIIEGVGRKYLNGLSTAHILGYIGEVSAEEVSEQNHNYEIGDLVGRSGIEGNYDTWLRGVNGARLVEVDTTGKLIRQAGSKSANPGRKIELTIDIDLQNQIFKILSESQQTGSVIVSQVNTGEILAMVSHPSYDPHVFNPNQTTENEDQLISLFNDEERPLVNRSIAAVYPPGSTFKIVTAAAALQTQAIQPDFTYEDTGVITVGEYQYRNWYLTQHGGQEGVIDIRRALARSTDTFFYKVGEIVGPQEMANWARKFGLGQVTSVGINEELRGLVPDPEWKIENIGERWYLGNTYHMSIGQGDLLATPVQVNQMTAVLANQGFLCPLKIINTPGIIPVTQCHNINLSKENMNFIIQGMVGACSEGGTAFPFFNYQPQVACKTGTAEFGPADEKGVRKTHAWLTAFAPVEKPEVVVTVLLESGGEGSKDAAPIAKQVMEKYFKQDLPSRILNENE